jgi:glycosyltransferase involved in cell wall biosynthesis
MNNNYKLTLDTSGWDFMIFQDSRPVTINKNTIKIIRYHDAIPLSDVDCMNDGTCSYHSQTLTRCKNDSFFVCNSEPTRESLISIIPELENRSCTLPYALPTIYKKSIDSNILKKIFIQRLSSLILNKDERNIRAEKINNAGEFNYILALSTLEPRKNYVSLIRAWELLRNKKGIKHKLVIVANKGWKYEEIKHAMKPGVENGSIIHLEKIPAEEISYLYSHASAFVFPSYNEGFGFPPLEAMQCECPVVVSDIKPHRWVMGDAALYCNPYSVDSIADAIGQLIASENADGLRQDLIAKGLKRIQKYHLDVISEQWQNLFDQLKAKAQIHKSR